MPWTKTIVVGEKYRRFVSPRPPDINNIDNLSGGLARQVYKKGRLFFLASELRCTIEDYPLNFYLWPFYGHKNYL